MEAPLGRILITVGSVASIAFGVWHFFVPRIWDWYSYMEAGATELVVAVRAINVFFSLSLVLFGLMNLALAHRAGTDRYSALVVVGATCVLWLVRVAMQIAFPQGTMNVALRYGMLTTFVVVSACYAVSFVLLVRDRAPGLP